MSEQDIKIPENVLEVIRKCLKSLKRQAGLWEKRGSGNKNAASSQEEKIAIHEQVAPPTGDEWALEVAEAVKVLSKKRNWSAPGPDKITNFWWKRANTLLKGVVESFKEVSKLFSEGKASLIPKEGEFLSENQRPIT